MTAFAIPSISRLNENVEEEEAFQTSSIRKDLSSAFNTPAVVKKRISRLSINFEKIPAESIKVYLRLRPFSEQELKDNEDQKCMKISDDRHILTTIAPKASKMYKASNRGVGEPVRHYTFTKIFDAVANQKEFYKETAHPLVKKFLEGNNALIFTYGVSNSGKTYTIQGSPGNEGIIPQAIDFVFEQIGDKIMEDVKFRPKMASNLCAIGENEVVERDTVKQEVLAMAEESRYSYGQKSQSSLESSLADSLNGSVGINGSRVSGDDSFLERSHMSGPVKYAVFVSFVEVYRDLVYDLLVPVSGDKNKTRPVLLIADDKKGTSYVKGMREIQVNSPEEILKVFSAGQKNLHVASTKLNKDSSRSHCVFTVTLVQVMDVPNPQGARISKISFCDLAGSERANKTGEAGDRLKEACRINSSLMKLGMCITDLRHNQMHKDDKSKQKVISFRDSKLTRVFRNYLLGDGLTCMIVNANMCSSGFDETAHVLKFSAIAKEIQIIKPKATESKKKSFASNFDEKFDSLVKAQKNPRMTIEWERKLTPVKDDEELADETEESDLEEGSEEEDSSDDEGDKTMECDVSYWKNREKKYLQVVDMLKKALAREKKNSEQKETAIREQYADFMHNQITQIERRHEESEEKTKDILAKEHNTRLQVMANLSNIQMKELKEMFENKFWDLTAKTTAVENELKECREELNGKNAEILAVGEKVTSLEVQNKEIVLELEEKNAELEKLKNKSRRSSIIPAAMEKDEAIQDLITQIEEGKIIIASLITEVDEHKSQIEQAQEDNEKLKAESESKQEKLATAADELAKVKTEETLLRNNLASKDEEYEKILSVMKEDKDSLAQKVQDLENDIKLLKQEHVQEIDDLKDKIKNYEEMTAKLDTAEKNLQICKKEAEESKNFEQQIVKETDRLHSELEKLRKENFEIKQVSQKRTSDVSEKSRELEVLMQDRDDLRERVETLRTKLTSVTKEKEKIKEELRDNIANSTTVQNTTELEELKTAVSEKNLQIEKLTSEKKELLSTLDMEKEKQKEITKYCIENEALKSSKEELEKEVAKLHGEVSTMKNDLKTLTETRKGLESKFEDGQKEIEELQSKAEKVFQNHETEIASLSGKHNETERNLEIMRESLKEMEKEVKISTEKQKDLESQLQDRINQYQMLQSETKKAAQAQETEKASLNEKCNEMKKDLEKLRKSLRDVEKEDAKLRKDSADVKSDLEEQLISKQNELKQVETFFAEFKTKTEGVIERMKNDHDVEIKSAKEAYGKEMKKLQSEDSKLRKNSAEEKSDLEEQLSDKQNELQQVQTSFAEFKTKTKEHIEQINKDHESEMKSQKDTHGKEIKKLQAELAQSKKVVNAKENELSSFRENRDKIVQALEVQISNDKASNKLLKDNLDEQIAELVKLKSENAAAVANNNELRKRLEEKEASGIAEQQSQTGRSLRKRQSKQTPDETLTESSKLMKSDEEAPPQEQTRSSRSSTVSKRGSSAGSRASRRRRNTARPATPIPEALPDASVEEDAVESPPKKLRSSRMSTRSKTGSVKDDAEEGILDDSELLKETGNARQFPKPTIEIDVTPDLTKKRTNAKKRVEIKEEPEELEEPGGTNTFSRASRSTRRKKEGNMNNNSNSSNKTSDEDVGPSSVASNLIRVGAMIKNSPVGHVLKAMSPGGSSPKKEKTATEYSQKKTKRLVKLRPKDISSPLEATPTPDSDTDYTVVSHTPARKLRSLRRKK